MDIHLFALTHNGLKNPWLSPKTIFQKSTWQLFFELIWDISLKNFFKTEGGVWGDRQADGHHASPLIVHWQKYNVEKIINSPLTCFGRLWRVKILANLSFDILTLLGFSRKIRNLEYFWVNGKVIWRKWRRSSQSVIVMVMCKPSDNKEAINTALFIGRKYIRRRRGWDTWMRTKI